MDGYGVKNDYLNWFSPYSIWEYFEPDDKMQKHVEESISISPEAYKIEYALSDMQHVNVETKIKENCLIIKLYKRKEILRGDRQSGDDVFQLFYRKKVSVLPDMLSEKMTTTILENVLIIEIPRKITSDVRENNAPTKNSFKETYFG